MKKKILKNSSRNSAGTTLAVMGASIVGLASSAYFFLGPNRKKNQKHIKAWMIKMKADVIEKLEQTREVSEPIYNNIIDSIATKYENSKKIDHTEVQKLTQDLKKHWKIIKGEAKVAKKETFKSVKKIIKKKSKKD